MHVIGQGPWVKWIQLPILVRNHHSSRVPFPQCPSRAQKCCLESVYVLVRFLRVSPFENVKKPTKHVKPYISLTTKNEDKHKAPDRMLNVCLFVLCLPLWSVEKTHDECFRCQKERAKSHNKPQSHVEADSSTTKSCKTGDSRDIARGVWLRWYSTHKAFTVNQNGKTDLGQKCM